MRQTCHRAWKETWDQSCGHDVRRPLRPLDVVMRWDTVRSGTTGGECSHRVIPTCPNVRSPGSNSTAPGGSGKGGDLDLFVRDSEGVPIIGPDSTAPPNLTLQRTRPTAAVSGNMKLAPGGPGR
jgi:hypothetical protein